jgi:hypothetical protein
MERWRCICGGTHSPDTRVCPSMSMPTVPSMLDSVRARLVAEPSQRSYTIGHAGLPHASDCAHKSGHDGPCRAAQKNEGALPVALPQLSPRDGLVRKEVDRAFRFIVGLDLRDHPVTEQREANAIVHELGPLLNSKRGNR